MPVYSLDFAKEILNLARYEYKKEKLNSNSLYGRDRVMNLQLKAAIRSVTYLSLLSCEISLKALLENAKMPVKKIRACSHDLNLLKRAVGFCEVEVEVVPGLKKWGGGFGLFCENIQIIYDGKIQSESTVGRLLTGLPKASKYPEEIRYGDKLSHYEPEAVLKMASSILEHAEKNWDKIRYKRPPKKRVV